QFSRLNTDENMSTPSRLALQGGPPLFPGGKEILVTFIIFSQGQEVDRVVGLVHSNVLKKHLDATYQDYISTLYISSDQTMRLPEGHQQVALVTGGSRGLGAATA